MSNTRPIADILDSVSITHKFGKDRLVFLNTSDVLEGKILTNDYMDVDTMKGQAKKSIRNGDILFSEIRPKNKRYALVNVPNPEDYVVSTKLMVLRNKTKDVLTKYVYYFLTYGGTLDYLQMRAENRIGSFPQITFDLLKELKVIVPEGPVQQRIVDVLSTLDAKIALNHRISNELESMAKTIYDYWFVQFDFPNENGKPYKSTGGQMIWNKELKRAIPVGWGKGTLSDIGTVVGGSTPAREIDEYYDVNGIAWITPKDLSNNNGNKYISRGENGVTREGMRAASLRVMPKGTILLSSRAPIGYMAIARNVVTTNQGFKSFVPDKGYSVPFVFYTVQRSLPAIVNQANGSTFKEISGSVLKSISVCLPPVPINDEFERAVESIFGMQNKIELENQTLTEVRDWLLPMLMNGQVKVK